MALGTISLVAEKDPSGRWVLLTLNCTGATLATLYRVSPDGNQAVRGAYEKAITGVMVAADYEAPQNTQLVYFARVSDGAQTRESEIVVVDGMIDRGGDVIFGLTNPLAWTQVNVQKFPSLKHAARQEVVQIAGRRDPVAVSDSRLFPSGTLSLITLEESDRLAMSALLAEGSIIAFSPRYPTYGFADVWYLAVGDVDENRVVDLGYQTERVWDLQVQRVAPPPATFVGPAFRTWQDLKDAGTTWGQLLTGSKSWLQLMVQGA